MNDLVERSPPTAADVFKAMSERIERNGLENFGGAAVIVSPDGKVISVLMVDESKETSQFWGLLKTRVQLEIQAATDSQRLGNAFGR